MGLIGFIIGACTLLTACKEQLPPKADADFLTRCHYTFYKSFDEAGPSGVMVDMQRDGKACHMIATAGHVVDIVRKQALWNNGYFIGFHKADNINVMRRIQGGLKQLQPCLHPKFPGEDIGMFIMPDVSGIIANKGMVCSINLDKPFASGVGFIQDESDYIHYGIGKGTRVFAFCSDLSKPLTNSGLDWNCTTTEKSGRIIDLNARIPTGSTNIFERAIVADFPSVEGNSGGPVFARGTVDGVEYPILLGVISGTSSSNGNLAYIAPIDSLIQLLHKQFDHPAKAKMCSTKTDLPRRTGNEAP